MIAGVVIVGTLIVNSLVWGYFLHRVTLQRDVAVRLLAGQYDAMRTDARRIRVLRNDREHSLALLQQAADALTFEVARSARLEIELAGSRHALAVQIAGPEERMSLLGSNVVAIRGAR